MLIAAKSWQLERMVKRSCADRITYLMALLEQKGDCWLATASATGLAHMIPISFYWDGAIVHMATWEKSVTHRNVHFNNRARIALPSTQDVVLIDGEIAIRSVAEIDDDLAVAFKAAAGFDPRHSSDLFVWLALTPTRILTWNSEEELDGREVMRHGTWLGE